MRCHTIKHLSLRAKISLILIGLMISPSLCHAAQLKQANDEDRLHFRISKTELNRLTFKGDRITNIIGATSDFEVEVDDVNGQLFFHYVGKLEKPIPMTIVTEKGHTQDLSLRPSECSAESLIIYSAQESHSAFDRKRHSVKEVKSQPVMIKSLMESMIKNSPHSDYHILASENKNTQKFHGLEFKEVKTYEGDRLKGVIFAVQNKSDKVIVIDMPSFTRARQTKAFYTKRASLSPSEVTLIYEVY